MGPVGTGDWGLGLGLDNYKMNVTFCLLKIFFNKFTEVTFDDDDNK